MGIERCESHSQPSPSIKGLPKIINITYTESDTNREVPPTDPLVAGHFLRTIMTSN